VKTLIPTIVARNRPRGEIKLRLDSARMFQRGIDGPDAERLEAGEPVGAHEELRRTTRSRALASGTLACARCDAPIALGGATVWPSTWLSCPFCLHYAPVRDFLSLAQPTRPARVTVRVVARRRVPTRQL
jgi:hypothetical protein